MEGKKTFFASLEPKSALIVGVVAGVLVLCTIGFFVLLGVVLNGKAGAASQSGTLTEDNTGVGQQQPAAATVVKSDRPTVELFVMAYCPYGLQMEKAFLPAWELLKGKADMSVKFVSYVMHGQKELEENTRQYCIEKEQPGKIIAYLKCFTGKDDYKACLATAGVDNSKLNSCVAATNSQYKIMEKFKDQSTWLSGQYPLYPIYDVLNQKYGVQGSPTLVINGAQSEASRTAEGVKSAICAAFNNPPSECSQKLSTTAYDPGFGTSASGGAAAGGAGCGTN